eukprot:97389_1
MAQPADDDESKQNTDEYTIKKLMESVNVENVDDCYKLFVEKGLSSMNDLKQISDDDLKKIGINSSSDRKKILNGIAKHFTEADSSSDDGLMGFGDANVIVKNSSNRGTM